VLGQIRERVVHRTRQQELAVVQLAKSHDLSLTRFVA